MRIAILLVCLASFGFVTLKQGPAKPEPAQLVLKNGVVYTGNDTQPKAEAVAVSYGRIIFVGSNADVQQYVGKKETRVVRRPDDQGRARQVFARARAIWRERRAEASNEFLHEAA